MAKTFHPKMVKIFLLRNTLKRIFMLFPEFTKNENLSPTKSDQIRPNPTGGFRRNTMVGFGWGSPRGDLSINQRVKKIPWPLSLGPVLVRVHSVFYLILGTKFKSNSMVLKRSLLEIICF